MGKFDVAATKRRATTIWGGFTAGQKTMLALALVGLVVGSMMFTKWAGQSAMTPLYTNLSAEDAAAVTQELSSQGVAYKLADGGKTVMVPQGDTVYQTRLDLSAKGLPSSGKSGYALLDKQGITTSEFRQRVDYQRALEGELARTITAIDGVSDADVHLVIPEDDIFTDDAAQPSASVLLHAQGGKRFSAGQVQSIVHLVASSVEGLTPDQVTVADNAGRTLSAPGDGDAMAAGDLQSVQAKSFEDELAASLTAMLTPVTGANGAVVRVNASLDFDERSTTTERFDNPENQTLLSESTSNETFTGNGTSAPGGLLGADAGVGDTSGQSNYQKEENSRQFAVSKVTEQVKAAPGRVTRLSVAVLLDDETKAKNDEVQALVAAAAGLDSERGDVVEVRRMEFDSTAAKEADEQAKAEAASAGKEQTMAMAQTGAVVLLVIVILFLAWRSAKKASVKRMPLDLGMLGAGNGSATARVMAAAGVPSGQEAEALAALAAARNALPPGAGIGDLAALGAGQPGGNTLTIAAPQVATEIRDLIEHQPEEVAQILRSWLADRRH